MADFINNLDKRTKKLSLNWSNFVSTVTYILGTSIFVRVRKATSIHRTQRPYANRWMQSHFAMQCHSSDSRLSVSHELPTKNQINLRQIIQHMCDLSWRIKRSYGSNRNRWCVSMMSPRLNGSFRQKVVALEWRIAVGMVVLAHRCLGQHERIAHNVGHHCERESGIVEKLLNYHHYYYDRHYLCHGSNHNNDYVLSWWLFVLIHIWIRYVFGALDLRKYVYGLC